MKIGVLGIVVFLLLMMPDSCKAATQEPIIDWQQEWQVEEVEQFLKDESDVTFSLKDYISGVISGETDFSLSELGTTLFDVVKEQIGEYRNTFLRILALGVFAGIFIRFAGTLGDENLGETGFYVVFLLLTGLLASGFFMAFEVAEDAIKRLLEFMKVLIPSFSLALCCGSGMQTSVVFYETMLIALGFLEMLLSGVLLPGVQIYFFLNIMNQLANHRFSRMVALVGTCLRWSVKILFGVLIGYQGIQGMLVPVMDKVKNNALWQSAKGLPGVGNTFSSVMDTILGSGVLIKSAIGVGGVIAIVVLCLVPLCKLLLFTLLYKVGGAVIQPVSDARIVALLQSTATSGKFLLWYLFAGALMFILSITIILVGTNMTIT